MPWQLHHVQLAIPPGEERRCDAFYVELLGFHEVEKPPLQAARGGRWYQRGEAALHLGVEEGFQPAKKAHPALAVDDFDDVIARLEDAGIEVRFDETIPGRRHCYVDDPVGNRLELIDVVSSR
ncbi:MAG TPA: VOC family protein [Acidimicrobiales bacterium]|nr:VOC family protein [Acidimicrobiales bacterium]